MIPISQNIVNEQSGIGQTTKFSVKAENMGVLFNILRNQLYADKIMAVIREYSANSTDANTMSGQPKRPIKVTLPSRLDSFLKIRDFGTGLSNDEVINTFCSYGESTKRQTQDAIGMLGIGCKSGFAYTDSFIVNSYQAGKMRSYNAYIDPSNCGAMGLLVESDTTEPDGLEIVIPVKTDDINRFKEKAMYLFTYFEILPDFENLRQDEKQTLEDNRASLGIISGDDWQLNEQGRALAIMGNIPYPIDASIFGSDLSYESQQLVSSGMILRFKIGELEISASREALQYSTETKKKILDKIKIVFDALSKKIAEDFTNCKTLWESKLLYRQFFRVGGKFYRYNNLIKTQKNQFRFGNHVINDNGFHLPIGASGAIYRTESQSQKENTNFIEVHENILVVENDTAICNGIANRIVALIESDPVTRAPAPYKTVYLVKFIDAAQKSKWMQDTGYDFGFTSLVTLPKYPLVKYYPNNSGGRTSSTKHISQEFVWDGVGKSHRQNKSDFWSEVEVDVKNDAGLYLKIQYFEYFDCRSNPQHPQNFEEIIKLLTDAGITVPKIYGFKHLSADVAEKNTNMVSFWTWIDGVLKNYASANPQLMQDYANFMAFRDISHSVLYNYIKMEKQFKGIGAMSPFKTHTSNIAALISQRKVLNAKQVQFESITRLFMNNGLSNNVIPTIDTLSDIQALQTRYPLISLVQEQIGEWALNSWMKHFEAYINMVDLTTP